MGRLINRMTNFSRLQSSMHGGKVQAYKLVVDYFHRSSGGSSEEIFSLNYQVAH